MVRIGFFKSSKKGSIFKVGPVATITGMFFKGGEEGISALKN